MLAQVSTPFFRSIKIIIPQSRSYKQHFLLHRFLVFRSSQFSSRMRPFPSPLAPLPQIKFPKKNRAGDYINTGILNRCGTMNIIIDARLSVYRLRLNILTENSLLIFRSTGCKLTFKLRQRLEEKGKILSHIKYLKSTAKFL